MNTCKEKDFSRNVMHLSLGKDSFPEAEITDSESCLSRLKQTHSLANRATFKNASQNDMVILTGSFWELCSPSVVLLQLVDIILLSFTSSTWPSPAPYHPPKKDSQNESSCSPGEGKQREEAGPKDSAWGRQRQGKWPGYKAVWQPLIRKLSVPNRLPSPYLASSQESQPPT